MAKKEPIRFAIDSNVLGWLAFAKLLSKEDFFYHTQTSEETYKNLQWLQGAMDAGRIELVLPYTVHHELIMKPVKLNLEEQKNMSPSERVTIDHYNFFREMSQTYLEQANGVKFAFMGDGNISEYMKRVENLAREYSEEPQIPEDLKLSEMAKYKPFLLKHGNAINDAKIMAEATLLGFDLISFDQHLIGRRGLNIPKAIFEINMETVNSNVRPVYFNDLMKAIRRENTDKPYLNKSFKPTPHPVLTQYEILDHEAYNEHVQNYLNAQQEILEENKKIYNLKTNFKFLDSTLEALQEKSLDNNPILQEYLNDNVSNMSENVDLTNNLSEKVEINSLNSENVENLNENSKITENLIENNLSENVEKTEKIANKTEFDIEKILKVERKNKMPTENIEKIDEMKTKFSKRKDFEELSEVDEKTYQDGFWGFPLVALDSKALLMLSAEYFCRFKKPKLYQKNQESFASLRIINDAIENDKLLPVLSKQTMECVKIEAEHIAQLKKKAEKNPNVDKNVLAKIEEQDLYYSRAIPFFMENYRLPFNPMQHSENISSLALEYLRRNPENKADQPIFDLTSSKKATAIHADELAVASLAGLDIISGFLFTGKTKDPEKLTDKIIKTNINKVGEECGAISINDAISMLQTQQPFAQGKDETREKIASAINFHLSRLKRRYYNDRIM